jgi:hypothetical protein
MKQIIPGVTSGQVFLATLNNQPTLYNVKDYGAYGDGIHDDTAAIQAAINAHVSDRKGSVYFPTGEYIIAGDLQTSINEINYNSQLYIPFRAANSPDRMQVRLIGESRLYLPSFPFVASNLSKSGVILHSTIQGTGDLPSVIASKGIHSAFGDLNYNDIYIENIYVMVDANITGSGPTISAFNMIYSHKTDMENCGAVIDVAITTSVLPQNHTYGLLVAPLNGEITSYVNGFLAMGFWCGCAAGEGAVFPRFSAWGNYIGFMALANVYEIHINNAVLHANCYAIAAQQDTVVYTSGATRLNIDYLTLEPRPTVGGIYWADWMEFQDVILDVNNFVYGTFQGDIKSVTGNHGVYLQRNNGGNNFLYKNLHLLSDYIWVTADRPANPGKGTRGFNLTTNKTEVWDGSVWQNCW